MKLTCFSIGEDSLLKQLKNTSDNCSRFICHSDQGEEFADADLPHIKATPQGSGDEDKKNAISVIEHNIFSKRFFKTESNYTELPSIGMKQFTKKNNEDPGYYLIACVLIYLYRLNNYVPGTAFLTHWHSSDNQSQCSGFFPRPLPLCFDFNKTTNTLQILHTIIHQINLFHNTKGIHSKIYSCQSSFKSSTIESAITIGFSSQEQILPEHSLVHFEINSKSQEMKIYHKIDCNLQGGELKLIVSNMSAHLQNILQWIFYNPKGLINQFSFLTDIEQKRTVIWGVGEQRVLPGGSISGLFEHCVYSSPDSPAVYQDGSVLSYYQLWEKAQKIAAFVIALNLPPQTLIGIYIHRSCEMLALMLGILKADCVYVPMDLKYPAYKIEMIIKEAKLAHIITTQTYFEQLNAQCTNESTLNLYDVMDILENQTVVERTRGEKVKPVKNKLAYIIFTSGTTGTPKGVLVSQKNVINYCYWFTQTTDFTNSSIIDFSSSLAFDLSVPCTLAPLLVGGAIALCEDKHKINPQLYLHHLQRYNVTHTELTPGYLKMLLQYPDEIQRLNNLRYLLLGADVVHTEEVSKWLSLCPTSQVINEYGPTETTVSSTSYFVNKSSDLKKAVVPIGRPAFNSSCYLLDKYLNLCPLGMPGELHIGGDQVALGYLGMRDLTHQKFIHMSAIGCNNLIYNSLRDIGASLNFGQRLYKTGDLASWLPEGQLQFLGRNDRQVKIQGYRIELPEIESILMRFESIFQAVVVIKEGKFGEKYLRAYLVSDEKLPSCEKIKEFLELYLPSYMHPEEFCLVSSIPLKENEKIDFDALEKMNFTLLLFTSEPMSCDLNHSEQVCLNIWRKIFNSHTIHHENDFFDIGGDSLIALQIISSLKNHYNINIPLSVLFECPTVTLLAKKLDEMILGRSNKADTPPLFLQQTSSLIKLSSGEYETPLFIVHPVGGSVFWYQQLAQKLEGKYTVYGIFDKSIDGHAQRFSSLIEMAKFYLEEINTIYKGERYCIGGASFGATVAYEMAKQLIESKKTIDFLGFFDGWAEYPSTIMEANTVDLLTKHDKRVGTTTYVYLQELEHYRKKLLIDYQLSVIATNVTLFKSRDLWDGFAKKDDPYNGWRSFIEGDIIVHQIPGTHETMFFDPHVEKLADKIILRVPSKRRYCE